MYAKVITSLLLLASLQVATPQAAAAPKIQHWQSSGGASVFFVPLRNLPIVDVEITFDAGSARDPKGKAGLALLTNSLLDEGAAGMDANAISFGFEKLGAQYGSDVDNDRASVSLRSLSDPKLLQPALANLQRVIGSPDFSDAALQRQRNRLLVAIQAKQQSPGALANDALRSAIYGDHPYATPTEGTGKSVKGLSRKAVRDFYQRYYTDGNASIAIVGDVDRDQAVAIAESLARVLNKGTAPPPLPPVLPLTSARDIHIPFDSTQTNIMMGQPGDYRGDPDYFTLYVGNHILGGGGFESRLTKEVRVKRGLSYYAYSYFIPWRRSGPFLAAAATRSREAEESVAVMKQTINDYIRNGPTKKELKAAKDNIIGGFPLKIDSNSDILGYVSMIGFYGLPLDYLDTFTRNVEAVTVKDIRSTFRRRLDVQHFVTVQVGQPASGEAQK
jgi:zinc protease